ncbi:hypothetical protein [Burkholderia sp. MBR-1]|uniref:hypothetical protein n=1 Tax=Burkholderia sp. MBR-1 TaxID=2732364 RepID=UPI0015EF55B6|nr:hypothetical protein [Burkholderia sp. MBR-1]QMI49701.1 hypothetical protein MBR110_29910 [Burkholderia sp. MBR-1]
MAERQLDRATSEWQEWITGSDLSDGGPRIFPSTAAALANLRPGLTAEDLWLGATGRASLVATSFGPIDEPWFAPANAALAQQTRSAYTSTAYQSDVYPWAAADVDGLTLDGATVALIRKATPQQHQQALSGVVPEAYAAEAQWILFCCGPDVRRAVYWSYYVGPAGAIEYPAPLWIQPDTAHQTKLVARARLFRLAVLLDFVPKGAPVDLACSAWLLASRAARRADSLLREAELAAASFISSENSPTAMTGVRAHMADPSSDVDYAAVFTELAPLIPPSTNLSALLSRHSRVVPPRLSLAETAGADLALRRITEQRNQVSGEASPRLRLRSSGDDTALASGEIAQGANSEGAFFGWWDTV